MSSDEIGWLDDVELRCDGEDLKFKSRFILNNEVKPEINFKSIKTLNFERFQQVLEMLWYRSTDGSTQL